jgi:tetratricopeptide repeat protein/photosynthetic reaction center cytochrome c subunit
MSKVPPTISTTPCRTASRPQVRDTGRREAYRRRMPLQRFAPIASAILIVFAVSPPAGAQIPTTFQNLQHFPRDIPRDDLIQRMREFSFALGVRCQYCHTGGDGISFEGVKFESDEKVAKQKARYMLKMVDEVNGKLLAGLPSRVTPTVRVDCATCHRGSALPRTLADELARIIAADGIDAAVQKYRDLRRDTMPLGKYDFGEWSMNELGDRLAREGNVDAAIAMFELNAEFYPKSADIDLRLGELYLKKGDKERAIAKFKAVLEKQPNNPRAKQRLTELSK